MIRAERFQMIAELGEKDSDGILTLEQLAEYLHVSMATVRRDVDELASRGVLQKTRGGVILQARETASLDPTYAMRLSVNMDEKNRIARAASAYIYEGDNIMFDSGSTVLELAKELGMENKVLMDVLKKKEVDVKSHMSTLEDDVVASIRSAYGKKHPAVNQETKAEEKQEAPKKKNIVQVFRPQNLKNGSRQGGRPNGQRAQRPGQNQQGQRQTGNQGQNQGQ